MSALKSRLFLLMTGFLYFFIPYVASRIRWAGTSYPQTPPGFAPGYGLFTDQQIIPPPGPNYTLFWILAVLGLVFILCMIFPTLVGFKKPAPLPPPTPVAWPRWFKPAFITMIAAWIVMWTRWPAPLFEYAFVPLWWGFILSVDGWTYRRNSGVSILSSRPGVFKLLFAFSSVAWFSFEYLNFFVVEIWYYPHNKIFTNFGFVFWYLLSFTVVWPGIINWYTLLRTFPNLGSRYLQGPKISFSRPVIWGLYVLGLIAFALMAYFPRPCFMFIWLAPILTIASAVALTGCWTPFRPIKDGNWRPLLVMAIAGFCNGVFYELWNEGSNYWYSSPTNSPNYWKYAVPYLDIGYIFSQMPILGYLGYFAFGAIVWSCWVYGAKVVGFPSEFDDSEVNP